MLEGGNVQTYCFRTELEQLSMFDCQLKGVCNLNKCSIKTPVGSVWQRYQDAEGPRYNKENPIKKNANKL